MKEKSNIQLIRFLVQAFFMLGLALAFFPKYNMVGKGLFFIILFVGVFFCGWVCPFGTIQDWIAKSARFFKIKRYQMPKSIQMYAQLSRYGLYILGTVGIVFAFLNAREEFTHQLFSGSIMLVGACILSAFLVASMFVDRPFCNYFCMKGARYGILSVLRVFGIKRDDSQCIHCHLCDKNCPMNISIEETEFVRHPNCINCMTCVSICPKKCIAFKCAALRLNRQKNKRTS